MTYRTDKFVAGDKVTWVDDEFATLTFGRERHGDGPFTIESVMDRERGFEDEMGFSMWDDMGHTQHLLFAGMNTYSGAFFKKV